jgi:hypothetical protein
MQAAFRRSLELMPAHESEAKAHSELHRQFHAAGARPGNLHGMELLLSPNRDVGFAAGHIGWRPSRMIVTVTNQNYREFYKVSNSFSRRGRRSIRDL